MHFNPAPVMRTVEVVSTVSTADEVAETVQALCASVGKIAVSCGDRAGFIVNALLFPYLNDAVKMLQAHYASADDIDTAMKYGFNALPMGPFELLDVVGNDVSLAIQRGLPGVPRARLRLRRRCSSTWSTCATSTARPSAGSATTPPATLLSAGSAPACGRWA